MSQKRDSLTGGYGIKTSKSSSHFQLSSGNRINLSKTEELAEIVNRQIWVQGMQQTNSRNVLNEVNRDQIEFS